MRIAIQQVAEGEWVSGTEFLGMYDVSVARMSALANAAEPRADDWELCFHAVDEHGELVASFRIYPEEHDAVAFDGFASLADLDLALETWCIDFIHGKHESMFVTM